ncbi:MAG: NTPase [Anaerolineales bacterium]|nr:NTPase [Anaerolineales bacterium]
MEKALLLTGRPGCGKTTLIRKVVAALDRPAGGFYTREIRSEGRRLGFEIVTLDGRSAVLAHVDFRSPQRVGKYGLELRALDDLGLSAVQAALQAGELVVIDEIGPMESRSARFRQAVLHVLESRAPLLGTIASRSAPFSDQVKRHPGVSLVEVTPANRDLLAQRILEMLS